MIEKSPAEFDFEWQNKLGDIGDLEDKLHAEAETRLLKLTRGHKDMIGASIILDHIDKASQTQYWFRARIVVYTRPDNIVAVTETNTAMAALKGSLDAVERQIREKRVKLREWWRQRPLS